MTRAPVLAAGGIVLRQARPMQVAVVRLRKRNEWVLPKGKLDDGETPRDAAEREVLEETGHEVAVHEFLGTLAYESGGRSKIVHYWRMETNGGPTRELMDDVRAVEWLPLDAAVARLSRVHERAFLANVGPLALESARRFRQSRPVEKPRRRRAVLPKPAPAISPPVTLPPADVVASAIEPSQPLLLDQVSPLEHDAPPCEFETIEAVSSDVSITPEIEEADPDAAMPDPVPLIQDQAEVAAPQKGLRIKLIRKVRKVKAWLQRAA